VDLKSIIEPSRISNNKSVVIPSYKQPAITSAHYHISNKADRKLSSIVYVKRLTSLEAREMSQYSGSSQVAKLVVVAVLLHTINAFNIANISPRIPLVSSTTSLYMGAMNRRNKAADLAAKMAEAKKQRESGK
jgi:hypothetical protein